MFEKYRLGKISEEVFRMYERNESPFELKYGLPPKPNELNFLCILEFSLGDENKKKNKKKKKRKKKGHGSPHLHILLKDFFLNVRGIKIIREVLEGHSRIFKVRRYFNLDLAKYALKYVKKAIVVKMTRDGREYYASDIKNFIHASLYWITSCRMFSISRHLEEEIKKRKGREGEERGKE